jgi:hypothetical protein
MKCTRCGSPAAADITSLMDTYGRRVRWVCAAGHSWWEPNEA